LSAVTANVHRLPLSPVRRSWAPLSPVGMCGISGTATAGSGRDVPGAHAVTVTRRTIVVTALAAERAGRWARRAVGWVAPPTVAELDDWPGLADEWVARVGVLGFYDAF